MFFGYKVLMIAVLAIPVVAMSTFALIIWINQTPEDKVQYAAAVEFHKHGQLDKAIGAYSKAIDLDSAYVEAFSGREKAFFGQGNLAQAQRDFGEAISHRSSLVVPRLGFLGHSSLKRAVAEAYVGRALIYTIIGNDVAAQQNIGHALGMGYDYDSAEAAVAEIKKNR
ncbi:MAG: tetratricopeptide repeat protein [Chloroflexi bacterium]|nr:tetratricopeptide repeat protein [Chloroflexota bacterium]